MSENIIMCENLVKIYKTKDLEVMALQGLELTVKRGELMAIIGNSGSGKSTFLNMVGGLDRPSAGKLFVNDKDLFAMKEGELREYKQKDVGFVWQNNARNLFPYLTALQNVELPMHFRNKGKKGETFGKEYALELLERVGMEHKRHSKLDELSGGEQQRIAIAIALANRPGLLLADEPTGNLDKKNSEEIVGLLKLSNKKYKQTILLITHDERIALEADRIIALEDGKILSDREVGR